VDAPHTTFCWICWILLSSAASAYYIVTPPVPIVIVSGQVSDADTLQHISHFGFAFMGVLHFTGLYLPSHLHAIHTAPSHQLSWEVAGSRCECHFSYGSIYWACTLILQCLGLVMQVTRVLAGIVRHACAHCCCYVIEIVLSTMHAD